MADFINVPMPKNEIMEGVLADPQTTFEWAGCTLIVKNPKYAPLVAHFLIATEADRHIFGI